MEMKDRIRQLRLEKGLTQDELGKLLGVSHSAIAKYENGMTANIKMATVAKMAKIFNCKPSYVMALDDDPKAVSVDMPGASEEFAKLAELYTMLNEEGKERLSQYIGDLASMVKYTK